MYACLLPHRYMEARLFGFVLDVYLTGTLVVEQHLPEYEFEIILVHVVAGTCHLVEVEIRQVECGAVAMAALRHGVDVPATLQLTNVLLRTQDRRHAKAVVRQVVAAEYIRPLLTYGIQFAFGRRDEVGHGVRQIVHHVIVAGFDLHQ